MANVQWLTTPNQWALLGNALLRAGEAGIDSETYNQPNRTSPQHRTKVWCWSIAVLGTKVSTRGYRFAHGVALPREALENVELRKVLQQIKLFAHNAPHDIHSFSNEGLDLDIYDTLQWSRVAVPGRTDYGLKSHGMKIGMEQWALGKPLREGFMDLMKYETEETRMKPCKIRVCLCGKEGCRARQTSDFWDEPTGWFLKHTKTEQISEKPITRLVKKRYDVPDFVESHPRWLRWLDYVVADAVSGIEIVDWLRTRRQEEKPYPWSTNEIWQQRL